jgi:F-type H+-transporting ATPase subunit delta
MREDSIARIYADALMQASEEKGLRKTVLEELESLALILQEEEDFQTFLESPQIDKSEKKKVLEKLFRDKLGVMTLHFLDVLLDKNRQYLLRQIAREYKDLDDEKEGIITVTVTSAHKVSAELEEVFRTKLESTLGTRIRLQVELDPSLLGGIIIRYEDMVLDGSIRKRLEELRDRTSALRLREGALYED